MSITRSESKDGAYRHIYQNGMNYHLCVADGYIWGDKLIITSNNYKNFSNLPPISCMEFDRLWDIAKNI